MLALPTFLAVAVALGASGIDAGPSPERATSDGRVPGAPTGAVALGATSVEAGPSPERATSDAGVPIAPTRAVALGATRVDAGPSSARAAAEPGAFAAANADGGPSPERATRDGGVPGAPTEAVELGARGVDARPSPGRAEGEPRALAPLDAGPSPVLAMDDAGAPAAPGTATTDVASAVTVSDAGSRGEAGAGDAEPRLRFRVWGATTAGWDGQQQVEIVTMHAVAHVRAGIEVGWRPLHARAVISLLTTARQRSEAWAAPQAADLGSHVELAWTPAAGHTIGLQLFPFDSSVVLPSFDWAQAWGRAMPAAPLGRLAYEGPRFGAWVALRQAQPLPSAAPRGSIEASTCSAARG